MNLNLSTIDVWTLEDEFSPKALLSELRMLLLDGDVIAFGAYNPSLRVCASLAALGATIADAGAIYSTTFDLNRAEYPNGCSFELSMSESILDALEWEAEQAGGQIDKPLFFDHVVAYRRDVPIVPLFCYHDAFNGGTLLLSGLYSEDTVRSFAAGLPSSYAFKRNPENYSAVA